MMVKKSKQEMDERGQVRRKRGNRTEEKILVFTCVS